MGSGLESRTSRALFFSVRTGRCERRASRSGLRLWLSTRLSIWSDADEPLTIADDTIGDRLELQPFSGLSLQNEIWWFPESSEGQTLTSQRQFFLIGEDRAGHGLLVGQPGNSFMITQLVAAVPGSANLDGGARRELSSWFGPDADYWVIDLATRERSLTKAQDLALTPWVPYTQPLPAVGATIFLDAAEIGHTFTLHSRPMGGEEQLQSVVAEAVFAQPGSWSTGYVDEDGIIHTLDHTGAEIAVSAAASAQVRGSVGLGMQFWLTRDADGASTPVQMAGVIGAPQWVLSGTLPPQPPAMTRIPLRVPQPAVSWTARCIIPGEPWMIDVPLTVDDRRAAHRR